VLVWYTSIIIRDWRGLAELLISIEWQCEGLGCGISKEVSPTSFFMSIIEVLIFNAEAGGVVGSVLCYGKTITCQDLSYKQF
jgi:hypothetical protein